MDKNNIYEELQKLIKSSNIFVDEQMKNHTSFKIGGVADFFIKAKTINEVEKVVKFAKENNILLTIIGNGSNLLVKDNGIRGITLKVDINNIEIDKNTVEFEKKINEIKNSNIEKDDNNLNKVNNINSKDNVSIKKNSNIDNKNVIVTVGAGVKLAILAQKLLDKSISGFEFACGIPGTIGGAIYMNAGAYGTEFKDIVIETKYIDKNGVIHCINNEQNKFGYRDSIFKNERFIILESKLILKKQDSKTIIKEKMDELLKDRKLKHPAYPSAGSTFKRGEDFITSKLIDESGLKGYKIGGAQVSEKHAGFIINAGNATAQDVIDLTEYVKKTVREKFGKDIYLEVEIVGE
ncbi:MAG TPA: UDP-N-acetylmuramate dehydrogenase [Clostridia bacterium]|nr:UDP-N-acetylmuramate dehydrogenase [Clostridia bacterium]